MRVISGSINTSLSGISEKISKRNEQWVLEEVQRQIDFGSDCLAINCGTHINTEVEDMLWLEQIVEDHFDIPLCFDSPSIAVHTACCHSLKKSRAFVDSITLEEDRIQSFMPLIKEMDAQFIILLYDEQGMPKTVEDRLRVLPKVEKLLDAYRIDPKDVYLDCIVFPISSVEDACTTYMNACKEVRNRYPEFQLSCGLNNVSYGLPERNLLNVVMMSMIAAHQQDAAIIEMNYELGAYLSAIRAMTGVDEFCIDYINAYRRGALGAMRKERA